MNNIGFFCCNAKHPDKFTQAGFVAGPVRATIFESAIDIQLAGYTGIYTNINDVDTVLRYKRMTGFPVPDKNQNLFPGLDYEVNQ